VLRTEGWVGAVLFPGFLSRRARPVAFDHALGDALMDEGCRLDSFRVLQDAVAVVAVFGDELLGLALEQLPCLPITLGAQGVLPPVDACSTVQLSLYR